MSWLTDTELAEWLASQTATTKQADADAISAANLAAHAALMSPTGGCGRDFTAVTVATVASDRTVEADQVGECGTLLYIPDCTAVTAIVGTSTESTDNYRLIRSGGEEFGETWPYDRVRHRSGWWGDSTWGYFTLTAKWGWPATPALIIEATKVLAKDLLALRTIQFGIAAITEAAGVRVRDNPFVADVVNKYRGTRTWVP
jgi:hypothetical protein